MPKPSRSSLIWGHLQEIHTTPAGKHYGKWFDKYGPTIQIDTACLGRSLLVSVDPTVIHHIFTTHCYQYTKSSFTRPFVERVLGHGLVWTEGDMHKLQRKRLSPAFSADSVRLMSPAIFDVGHKLVTHLQAQIESGLSVVEIHDLVAKTTLDILGRVALNHDFDCLNGGALEIRKKWRDQANAHITSKGLWITATLRTFPWIGHLPFSFVKEQGSVRKVVTPLSEQIIAETKGLQKDIRATNLLSILLQAEDLSKSELLDNISTFIVAGFDSTSAALTWCLLSLAQNSTAQDTLREEILNFGKEPTEADLTSSTCLPYLDAVTKETLRMYPATDAERLALHDDIVPLRFPITLPSGKKITEITIHKGDTVIIPLICSNRLNLVWKDGDVWRPDRWLSSLPPKDDMAHGWANLVTFSEGPRNCIGYRLAILEFKIVLALLVRHFIFELPHHGMVVQGYYFASLLPVVNGKTQEGASLPLRVRSVI